MLGRGEPPHGAKHTAHVKLHRVLTVAIQNGPKATPIVACSPLCSVESAQRGHAHMPQLNICSSTCCCGPRHNRRPRLPLRLPMTRRTPPPVAGAHAGVYGVGNYRGSSSRRAKRRGPNGQCCHVKYLYDSTKVKPFHLLSVPARWIHKHSDHF